MDNATGGQMDTARGEGGTEGGTGMSKCCNSCGMLNCNRGNKKENDGLLWYSQENLDRLWQECKRTGQFLICHSTDSKAAEYSGIPGIPQGKETACLGLTVWIFMHIKIFEIPARGSYKRYVTIVGKDVAMTNNAMLRAAMDFVTGSTGFGTTGPLKGLLIPQEINESREIRVPTGFEKTVKAFNKVIPDLKGLLV